MHTHAPPCSLPLSTCSCAVALMSVLCAPAGRSSCCRRWWSGSGWRWLTRGTGAASRWTAMTCGRRPGSCCREWTASPGSWSKSAECTSAALCHTCLSFPVNSGRAEGSVVAWGGAGVLRLVAACVAKSAPGVCSHPWMSWLHGNGCLTISQLDRARNLLIRAYMVVAFFFPLLPIRFCLLMRGWNLLLIVWFTLLCYKMPKCNWQGCRYFSGLCFQH